MGKIEVKLRDKYPNKFVTTIAGAIIKKDEWSEVDEDDYEIRHFLETDTIIEVKGKEEMEKAIILNDIPPKHTIKEIVTPSALEENAESIKRTKRKKDADSSDFTE